MELSGSNIKVLWIDDEWEKQDSLIGDAEQEDIDIYPTGSHEEGIELLEERPGFYQAVILDAKVKLKRESTTTKLEGLRASRDYLMKLNQSHFIPFFIFTGQADYMDNEDFRDSFGQFFVKGKDNTKLFEAIKAEVGRSDEMKARKEFPEAFVCFDMGIVDNNGKELFIEMVKNLRLKDYHKKNINGQRDLLEAIFCALNKSIPCIPDKLFRGGHPNLEGCVVYLENRETKDYNGNTFRLDKQVPKDIRASFRKLKESTNEYSHNIGNQELAKYPFLSNTYLIMEILIWLPKFAEENYKNHI